MVDAIGGSVPSAIRAACRLAAAAITALPADAASVHLVDGAGEGRLRLVANQGLSDGLIEYLDQRHDATPMVDAYGAGSVVQVPEITDPHYENFARRTHESDQIAATVAAPVVDGASSVVGVVVAYYRSPGVRDAVPVARVAIDLGAALAWPATSIDAELADQILHLQTALATRSVIEQAKGILMARTGRDAEEAFALLRHQSQSENRKVREIAEEIVRRTAHND